MEQGTSAHLPNTEGGALVPAETYIAPLLPYERQLIQALGVTEQEYRELTAELARSIKERGPEYDHIPDIKNDAVITPILINLAIGLILTGVSVLLSPKPQKPDQEDPIKQKNFGNQVGRSRFNNSVGFDGAPQLAQLASRIPIPFGRYEEYNDGVPDEEEEVGSTGVPSGGMIVEPLLVWSRMQSNGGFQSLKALLVVGQAGIETEPNVEGVMIGGQPIANFYKSNYAVFWNSTPDGNLLNLDYLIAGEASPAGNWLVPTGTQDNGYGFSSAYSPNNTTQFGVYESIYNGGHFKLNWKVISVPEQSGNNDPGFRLSAEISKIAGRDPSADDDGNWGMAGIGKAYSNFCGLVGHNGADYAEPTVVTARRGDRFKYRISGRQMTRSEAKIKGADDVGVQDVNNAINSRRERCDALLVVGQTFLCNRTLMRVVSRPNRAFDKTDQGIMDYELEVISFVGGNYEVGLAGTNAVQNPLLWKGATTEPESYFRSVSWYPLHRVDIGQVKNTRPVEVTEIGIRSQVWAQINGLCNFNNVPTPDALQDYNDDRYQINAGQVNKYAARVSYFTLGVKKIGSEQGLDSEGKDVNDSDYLFDGFDTLNGIMFGVRGSTPIDVYNFIRIKPETKGQYEYRLIPKDACTIHRYEFYKNQQVYFLDIDGPKQGYSESTVYGTMTLTFNGTSVAVGNYFSLDELRTDPDAKYIKLICTSAFLRWVGVVNDSGGVGNAGGGRQQAYLETILGQLKDPTNLGGGDKALFGESRTRRFNFTDKGVTFNCEMDGYVQDLRNDPNADQIFNDTGTMKRWIVTRVAVLSFSGSPSADGTQDYDDTRNVGKSWYAYWFGFGGQVTGRYSGTLQCVPDNQVDLGDDDGIREFERHAQIKEMSTYDEIRRSCETGPEHAITYINESLDNTTQADYQNLTMLGIKLRSLNQVQSFAQPQLYLKDGIVMDRFIGGRGPTNNFADVVYWLLTSQGSSLGQEISSRLVDTESFAQTAKFYRQTRCRFDGAIADQVNLRSFITELAPLFLSNFVIKNGKFALVPAVPVDGDGNLHTGPMNVDAFFTDGNIIDGTFDLEYLAQSDREDFRAVIQYREQPVNGLSVGRTILVKWKDEPGPQPAQETIDAQQFITRRGHAFLAARYLLSVRRRVDHVITFKTAPTGLSLAPGSYIRVDSQISPYESSRNIVINKELELVTPTPLDDGTYSAHIYRQGTDEVITEDIEVKNNKVVDTTLRYALMNIPSIARRWGVYQVDQVTLEEDGLVEIKASHFPVFNDMRSKIVDDILFANRYEKFEVVE